MKITRLFIGLICLLFLMPTTSLAIDWITANQSTIQWDPVTTLNDGSPLPVNDAISYRVYLRKLPGAVISLLGETVDTRFTVTLVQEGRYTVGVQSIRIPEGETDEVESEITWSDSSEVEAVPNPFGLKYFITPGKPKNLRP